MTVKKEESKKSFFERIRETFSKKWERFFAKNKTAIGICIIILLGGIACSPILVFSSINFLSSIPIFYKILAFLLSSGITLTCFFKSTIKTISKQSKTLKTFYGWDDAIAVLLLIYGIYSFLMQPTVGFLIEFRAELIGAGIATLLIGNASQAAQIQEEKKRLILQMGSPDNGFAVEAARQLRQQGWLEDGSLKGVNLHDTNLTGANLNFANLSGVNFQWANLDGARLDGANLRGALLSRANLSGVHLGEADLSGANLLLANFSGARSWSANFSGANLCRANFSGADLEEANFSGADLKWANLSGVNLYLANLCEANLWQANLSGADLREAKFYDDLLIDSDRFGEITYPWNAFYTEGVNSTIFSEGYNPADHGMNLIHEGESYEEAVKRVLHKKG